MTTFGTHSLSRLLLAGSAAGLAALAVASPAQAQDGRWGGYGSYDRDYDHGGHYFRGGNPRAAVRQCTAVTQRVAARQGRADVTQIRDVDRTGRGYVVRGRLEVNQRGWNDNYWRRGDWNRDTGSFTCRVEFGRVVDLDIDGIRGL